MKTIFTTFVIMNTVGAFVKQNYLTAKPLGTFRIQNRNIHFTVTNFMVTENDADTIITTRIIEHAVKKKIVTEVTNDSDILQSFDTLNPLYIVELIVSSICSSDIKYNDKIEKLQKTNPKPIYRWLDFTMLVMVITLMKNVKNAI